MQKSDVPMERTKIKKLSGIVKLAQQVTSVTIQWALWYWITLQQCAQWEAIAQMEQDILTSSCALLELSATLQVKFNFIVRH